MLKLCRAHYFHPGMGGSNSIKWVLESIWRSDAATRARFAAVLGRAGDANASPYDSLPPLLIANEEVTVSEGTGAMRAYFAMVYGYERDDPEASDRWARLLREYCKLDTLAMVLIWERWARALR